jgi:hypothetical protein
MIAKSKGASEVRRLAAALGALYLATHVLAKVAFFPGHFTGNDSPTFITPAISFAENLTFSAMIWRPPLYSIFLGLHRIVFGADAWLTAACYSQIALMAIAVSLMASVLRAAGVRRAYVVIFALIMVLYPANFFYENRIMSEVPAFFWVAILAWCGWRLHESFSRALALIVGLVAGIGPLLRPEYVSISLFAALYLAVAGASGKIDYTKAVGFCVAALACGPALFWALRNYIAYSFFGLTAGVGATLFFHTYPQIELGRTSLNAPAIDRVLPYLKRENVPNVVFDAEPLDATIDARVRYWQQITDATLRAIVAEPFAYARSVGRALVGTAHPALGRQQLKEFFGAGEGWFRLNQGAHAIAIVMALALAAVAAISTIIRFRRRSFRDCYLAFLLGAVASDLVLTALLINGPNNRYRMPFDGVIVMTGVIAWSALFQSRRQRTRSIP